jgi:hypothetical protein
MSECDEQFRINFHASMIFELGFKNQSSNPQYGKENHDKKNL